MIEAIERWRDIPGYEGRYQASTEGRIRKAWPGARKPLILAQGLRRKKEKMLYVRLYNGSRYASLPVLRLVALAFCKVPEGSLVIHKNGLHSDNRLCNVEIMTPQEAGSRVCGRHHARPVVMIDRQGEIVECFGSAREAGRRTGVCFECVRDRCNRTVRDEFRLTGYSYRWDDV